MCTRSWLVSLRSSCIGRSENFRALDKAEYAIEYVYVLKT